MVKVLKTPIEGTSQLFIINVCHDVWYIKNVQYVINLNDKAPLYRLCHDKESDVCV